MLVTLGRGMSRQSVLPVLPTLALPSPVFDLDASVAASYGGSGQVWANLTALPADGSAMADYDFHLGAAGTAGADDPAFNGAAGASGAYFSLDGGDMFTLQSGANTAFLNALHKTAGGTPFWLAMAMRMVDLSATAVALSTKTTASAPGFNMQFTTSEQVRFQQTDGAGASVITSGNDHPAIAPGSDTLIIASASGSVMRSWVNNRSKVERAMAFNPNGADAGGYLTISGQAGGGGAAARLPGGTRIYAVAMGMGFIDNAEAGLIFDLYNTRHGRSYA